MCPEKNSQVFSVFRMLVCIMLSAGLLLLSACGPGLPDEARNQAKSMPDTIAQARKQVEKQKSQYAKLSASPDFDAFKTYAQKEAWHRQFDQAAGILAKASEIEKSQLTPIAKKNKAESLKQVYALIKQTREMVQQALQTAQAPAQRYAAIRKTIENVGTIAQDAAADSEKIRTVVQETKTSVLAKTLEDFPEAADKTQNKFAPLSLMASDADQQLEIINTQTYLHNAGKNADYALLTDQAAALSKNATTVEKAAKEFEQKTRQLYTSYTKILKDMKTEYTVIIRRESWDESSDYYNPAYTMFTRTVTPEVYETLTADGVDSIGEVKHGFRGSSFTTPFNDAWKKLNLNPGDQWPGRGHNAASFWVEDTREAYFHQYILESDGETQETGWEKVGEGFYEANLENLGMAIVSKPYGTYEDDKLTQAAPPGMAYVNNPAYGEWKTDQNGDRFWSWYGRYAFFSSLFFFPPTYYHYGSWNRWNRDYRYSRPYYGTSANGFQKYGTYGNQVKNSSRFKNSHFARSGGLKSQAASVRGAGPGLRGGGPKGKGK